MGLFRGTRLVAGQIVNIKVHEWININYLKTSVKNTFNSAKGLFVPNQALREETFAEALARMELTENDLQDRVKEFNRLIIIHIILASIIFLYAIYITIVHANLLGLAMGCAVTLLALGNALRYHFWSFQIKKRKLGCSLADWWNATKE